MNSRAAFGTFILLFFSFLFPYILFAAGVLSIDAASLLSAPWGRIFTTHLPELVRLSYYIESCPKDTLASPFLYLHYALRS